MGQMSDDVIRVFVGSDRSQLLAVKVLEHSIRRHTASDVEVTSMDALDLPDPKDIRQGKRTGFSFTRFAVPELAGYHGRAVYLDADMLVFRDFEELWSIPFDGKNIIIQEGIPDATQPHGKLGAPKKRIKQCSVMLMDCDAAKWDVRKIIDGLDGTYTYEELMYDFCILQESEIKYGVPFEWNSLEHFEKGQTGLIHYTDMLTQPWVNPDNKNGYLWHNEVRMMLEGGSLAMDEVKAEVDLGYFRPSLVQELEMGPQSGPLAPDVIDQFNKFDRDAGFVMHKEVYDAKRRRKKAIKKYELELAAQEGATSALQYGASSAFKSLANNAMRVLRRATTR